VEVVVIVAVMPAPDTTRGNKEQYKLTGFHFGASVAVPVIARFFKHDWMQRREDLYKTIQGQQGWLRASTLKPAAALRERHAYFRAVRGVMARQDSPRPPVRASRSN
jgi:hypothetical protein